MTSWAGEAAAFATALCFAVCTLAFAFAGRRVDAQTVNVVRLVAACLVLGVVQFACDGRLWPSRTTPTQFGLLLASGVVGLAFGDMCLFSCLVRVGPRLGSLLMALAPGMTAVLAMFALDERLTVDRWVGIAVVSGGVALVIRGGGRDTWDPAGAGSFGAGVLLGVLAALGQAAGLVLSKAGMHGGFGEPASSVPLDPLPATVIRLIAGAVGTIAFLFCARVRIRPRRVLADPFVWRWTTLGILAGPVLGVWLSMVAVAEAEAGIAATLMATTPVLMIPIARVAYGSRPGALAVLGTLVAVAGVVVLEVGLPWF